MEAVYLDKCKRLNKLKSEEPNFQTCMLDLPLRIKAGREEIFMDSFHKLKISVLKELYCLVVGSTHSLEMLCAWKINEILQQRNGEDLKLDKARRKTLNAFPGRRFKLD